MPKSVRVQWLLLLCLALTGCATLPPNSQRDARDPWERVNRSTYKFNDAVDRGIYRPVARGYVKVTPRPVRTSISNFLDNLAYPVTIVNDLLQLKLPQFGRDTTRFLVNSTVGLGGLFDVASPSGLDKNENDLGQTFGHWGAGPGPYLVVPFFGPSDIRDGIGRVGDIWLDPRHYIKNGWISWPLWGLDVVDLRARLLSSDYLLDQAYDPYTFLRNAYLQRRDYLINSGKGNQQQRDQQQYDEEKKILEESEGGAEPDSGAKAPPDGKTPASKEPRQDELRPPPEPAAPQEQQPPQH
jgi:phospholipid-binding lipoprotein MlaA